METKREENVVASKPLIPSIEITLGHRECVAEVESPIHVRERESLKELVLVVWFSVEKLISFPDKSSPVLEGNELVPAGSVLHDFD